MGAEGQNQFASITSSFVAFLPSLLGGLGLVLLGLILGWLMKKAIVQLAMVLRLDRVLSRSRWKDDLKKADVRFSLYNLAGNFVFAVVLLIFLDNAFIAWKLTMLSDLLSMGILYLPKLIIAAVIWGLGWLVSSGAQRSVTRTLLGEGIPRASLISRFIKSVLMLFFTSMAMVELNIAREIVIIGFAATIASLGAVAVVFAALGGKRLLGDGDEPEPEEPGKDEGRGS
jgi:hypothetical protein